MTIIKIDNEFIGDDGRLVKEYPDAHQFPETSKKSNSGFGFQRDSASAEYFRRIRIYQRQAKKTKQPMPVVKVIKNYGYIDERVVLSNMCYTCEAVSVFTLNGLEFCKPCYLEQISS
jgi:hypothetical protein